MKPLLMIGLSFVFYLEKPLGGGRDD